MDGNRVTLKSGGAYFRKNFVSCFLEMTCRIRNGTKMTQLERHLSGWQRSLEQLGTPLERLGTSLELLVFLGPPFSLLSA